MTSRQEISDEEIQRFMDFDKLLREKEKVVARRKYLRNIKILASAFGVIVAGTVFFLTVKNQPAAKVSEPVQNDVAGSIQKTDSSTVQLSVTSEVKRTSPDDISIEQKKPASPGGQKHALTSDPEIDSDEKVGAKEHDNSELFQTKIVYQQAEPVNGYPDLYTYFEKELIYPTGALKDSIQGVVTVVFTINASGKAEDVQIENSLGKLFDEEVRRVLGNMPLWKPAYYNGKLMKSKVSLPLTFTLTKVSAKE